MKNFTIGGVEVKLEELKNQSRLFWGWVTALVITILVGFYAWTFQWPVREGLVVTGMRDVYSWGFYIQNFILFVGLAAGGLVIYSSIHLFGAKQFNPVSRIAVVQAAVCIAIAALFVAVDIGNPQRIFWFFVTPNFKSVFIYDFAVINFYLALSVFDAWVLMSGRGTPRIELALTLIALPTAISLHSVTGWVLSLQKAREAVHTALMAPMFITKALVSGIALLILIVIIINRFTHLKFKDKMIASLAGLLAVSIAVDLFFIFCEVLTSLWPTSTTPGHLERIMLLLTGKYAPFFWVEVIIGGIIPFFVFAIPKTRGIRWVQIVTCIAVLFGEFNKGLSFLVQGLAISPIGHIKQSYFPSLEEFLVGAMLWALGLLIFTFVVKLLPVKVPEEEHH